MAEIKPVRNHQTRRRGRRKLFIIIGIVIVFMVVMFLLFGRKGEALPMVNIAKVETGDITSKVNSTGRVKPKAEVKIQAEIYEIIVAIPVKEGDSVKIGDLLVRLKQSAYQYAVDNARADLETARANYQQAKSNLEYWDFKYKQMRELFDKNLAHEEQLMSTKDQYTSSQATVASTEQTVQKGEIALKQAQDYYDKTEIRSPINGVVTQLDYEVGERTMIASPNVPGAVIMTISDLATLEVEVRVDETDIKDVKIGQEAEITVDAFPDTTFKGVVTNVGSSAQITGYTQSEQVTDFLVKVQFLENYKYIKPNLTAEVDIITGTAKDVRHVPIQAIVAKDKSSWEKKDSNLVAEDPRDSSLQKKDVKLDEGVFLYDNGVAKFCKVTLGIKDQTNIEVTSGLEVGQEVISGPYAALRGMKDGDRVNKREQVKKSG